LKPLDLLFKLIPEEYKQPQKTWKMKSLKSIILIALMICWAVPAECQKSVSDGKIKSMVVSEEKYDMLVKKQFKESETFYDIKGNVTETTTYKQGKLDKHFKYQYDSDNNKIKEEEFDPTGRLKESSEYKYANGMRIEKTVFDANKKLKSKKTYVYTTY
jgi:hypothetical protein